jgi:hypothetical protein
MASNASNTPSVPQTPVTPPAFQIFTTPQTPNQPTTHATPSAPLKLMNPHPSQKLSCKRKLDMGVSSSDFLSQAASASDNQSFSFGLLSQMKTRDDEIEDQIRGIDSSFIRAVNITIGSVTMVAYCPRCNFCFQSYTDVNYHIYHHHMPSGELRRSYGHRSPTYIEPSSIEWHVLNQMYPFPDPNAHLPPSLLTKITEEEFKEELDSVLKTRNAGALHQYLQHLIERLADHNFSRDFANDCIPTLMNLFHAQYIASTYASQIFLILFKNTKINFREFGELGGNHVIPFIEQDLITGVITMQEGKSMLSFLRIAASFFPRNLCDQ